MTHIPPDLSDERVREIVREFEGLLSDMQDAGQQPDGPGSVSSHYTSLSVAEVVALARRAADRAPTPPVRSQNRGA